MVAVWWGSAPGRAGVPDRPGLAVSVIAARDLSVKAVSSRLGRAI